MDNRAVLVMVLIALIVAVFIYSPPFKSAPIGHAIIQDIGQGCKLITYQTGQSRTLLEDEGSNNPYYELHMGNYQNAQRNSLLRFDDLLLNIPQGYSVTSAKLTLTFQQSFSGVPSVVKLFEGMRPFIDTPASWYYYAQNAAWNTLGADWKDANGVIQGAAAFSTVTVPGNTQPNTLFVFDATQIVKNAVAQGKDYGFVFYGQDSLNTMNRFVGMRDYNAGKRPKLEVTACSGGAPSPTPNATIIPSPTPSPSAVPSPSTIPSPSIVPSPSPSPTPIPDNKTAFEMKTYIEDDLDYNVDSYRYTLQSSRFGSGTSSFGPNLGPKMITRSHTTLLDPAIGLAPDGRIAYPKGSVITVENQNVYAFAYTNYDETAKQVQAKFSKTGYEVVFNSPIPLCLDTSKNAANCTADTDKLSRAHIGITFLGDLWQIFDYNIPSPSNGIVTMVTLGKEITKKEIFQIGEQVTTPDGYAIKLTDLSAFSPQRAAFDISDKYGNLVKRVYLGEGESSTIAEANYLVLKVNKIFPGAFAQQPTADVSMYSSQLIITNDQEITGGNSHKNWKGKIVSGFVGSSEAISKIQLYNDIDQTYKVPISQTLNPGESIDIVKGLAGFKLNYLGLQSVDYDSLSFSVQKSQTLTMQNGVASGDFIYVQSGRSSAFQFPNGNVAYAYFGIQGNQTTPNGTVSIKGKVYYIDSNGYAKENSPPGKLIYQYSDELSVMELTFPDASSAAIAIPEKTDDSQLGVRYKAESWHLNLLYDVNLRQFVNAIGFTTVDKVGYSFGNSDSFATKQTGYTSYRGAIFSRISATSASFNYPVSIVKARYTLTAAASQQPLPSPSPSPSPSVMPTCSDTDGGALPFVYGMTYNSTFTYNDSCTNPTILMEGYCSGNQVKSQLIYCYNLGNFYCFDGKCITSPIISPSPSPTPSPSVIPSPTPSPSVIPSPTPSPSVVPSPSPVACTNVTLTLGNSRTLLENENYNNPYYDLHMGNYMSQQRNSVLKFNNLLTSIPPNYQISSAKITLYLVISFSGVPSTVKLFEGVKPYSAVYVDWYNYDSGKPWSTLGGDWKDSAGALQGTSAFSSVTVPGYTYSNTPFVFDATQIVRNFRQQGTDYGFFFFGQDASNTMNRFAGTTYSDATKRPKLEMVLCPP